MIFPVALSFLGLEVQCVLYLTGGFILVVPCFSQEEECLCVNPTPRINGWNMLLPVKGPVGQELPDQNQGPKNICDSGLLF